MRRVCLVGAGQIAPVHAEALAGLRDVELVGVCDIDTPSARRVARQYGAEHVFSSVTEAIASHTFEFAHVLVPPDRHVEAAEQFVDAGIGVLLEKPMGLSRGQCDGLVSRANAGGVSLGVNHNSVFYPAYLRLRQEIIERSCGALQHVMVAVIQPLNWLSRPGHWKLQRPQNLVYETLVHPFSQVYDLAGPVINAATTVSGRHEPEPGRYFFDTWQVSLVCERATAQVYLSHAPYRMFRVVAICEDGVLLGDVEQNRFAVLDRTRWGPHFEPFHIAKRLAMPELARGLGNLAQAARSMLRSTSEPDSYIASMTDSVAAFHQAATVKRLGTDGNAGAEVIAMCDATTRDISDLDAAAETSMTQPRSAAASRSTRCDVAVLGGATVFGETMVVRAALIDQLIGAGQQIRVMVGDVRDLRPGIDGRGVELVRGEMADIDTLATVVRGARSVVHLAPDWKTHLADDRPNFGEHARELVDTCARLGVDRLRFVGSVSRRSSHLTEALIGYARQRSMAVTVLEAGIVLGAGGEPFHPGFGIWGDGTHCTGWNQGTNPLPLVLLGDLASAVGLACEHDLSARTSYDVVGDIRMSAREYVRELAQALDRPVSFHGSHPARRQAMRITKWLVTRTLSRSEAPFPRYQPLASMGCPGSFDGAPLKRDLGWAPVADRSEFIDRGLRVHRRRFHA
jgi:predicted dehydrogenase/nucleoside-diphosphate-sugar epimerase